MFIAFDGPDACGKTTMLKRVAAKLRERDGDMSCMVREFPLRTDLVTEYLSGGHVPPLLFQAECLAQRFRMSTFIRRANFSSRSNHLIAGRWLISGIVYGTYDLLKETNNETRWYDARCMSTMRSLHEGLASPDVTLVYMPTWEEIEQRIKDSNRGEYYEDLAVQRRIFELFQLYRISYKDPHTYFMNTKSMSVDEQAEETYNQLRHFVGGI